MTTSQQLRAQVVSRARQRCEYCQMHQSLQGATFHVEHIRPLSKGGQDDLSNLALACPSCNLQKSDRTHATDSSTGETVELFHPRKQAWHEHFDWDAYAIEGRTESGRATVLALQFNHFRRLQIREAEQRLGLFPPIEDQ